MPSRKLPLAARGGPSVGQDLGFLALSRKNVVPVFCIGGEVKKSEFLAQFIEKNQGEAEQNGPAPELAEAAGVLEHEESGEDAENQANADSAHEVEGGEKDGGV